VLITGVSGLIGTRLGSLLAPGYAVVGLDFREPPERLPDETNFFHCDLTRDASTEQALAQGSPSSDVDSLRALRAPWNGPCSSFNARNVPAGCPRGQGGPQWTSEP